MSEDRTGCAHDFGEWEGNPAIEDVLLRRCRRCPVRELRILPPVRSRPRPERGWWNWEETA